MLQFYGFLEGIFEKKLVPQIAATLKYVQNKCALAELSGVGAVSPAHFRTMSPKKSSSKWYPHLQMLSLRVLNSLCLLGRSASAPARS
jgi:hypothetical protein